MSHEKSGGAGYGDAPVCTNLTPVHKQVLGADVGDPATYGFADRRPMILIDVVDTDTIDLADGDVFQYSGSADASLLLNPPVDACDRNDLWIVNDSYFYLGISPVSNNINNTYDLIMQPRTAVHLVHDSAALNWIIVANREMNIFRRIPQSGWGWDNQDSAVVVDNGKTFIFTKPATGGTAASNSVYYRFSTFPLARTVTAAIELIAFGKDFSNARLVLRNQASGDLILFGVQYNAGWFLSIITATDPTTEIANLKALPIPISNSIIWLRIANDGVNRTYLWSNDGITFQQFYTEAATQFITADQAGVSLDSRNATESITSILHSWQVVA